MENSVRHEGTIESIEDRHIRVRIVQNSACAACKVASRCNASESKIKIVDVYDEEAAKTHQVGDSVVVSTSSRSAGRALLLGFWELGGGIGALRGLAPTPGNLALAAALVGWGGVSVQFQTLAVLADSDSKTSLHLAGRFMSAVFGAALAYGMGRIFL